jgi:adenylate kinase
MGLAREVSKLGDSYKLFYVTGAPASGKTTLITNLEAKISPCKAIGYGTLIRQALAEEGTDTTYSELREKSSKIVSSGTVSSLDEKIADDLERWLSNSHIIIGSHSVNYEDYGLRITPFSAAVLSRLPMSAIIVLEVAPDELVRRRGEDSGRVWSTCEEAARLQALQTQVGLVYGIITASPVYIFDANQEPSRLCQTVLDALLRDKILFESDCL